MCQVTGKRRRSVDLPQGGLEVPCSLMFMGKSQDIRKVKKLAALAPSASIEPCLKKPKIENDVDDTDSTQEGDSEDQHWLQYKDCLLTQQDRTAITSNNLLSDRHINYAQVILHQQFPLVGGLKNTLLQGRPQQRKIHSGGLQIIHDRGNHWIVASAVGSDGTVESVQVYDSIFSSEADGTVSVIKNLFAVTGTTPIEVKKIQHQRGSRDCGVFAIAVCTAFLNGVDVSTVTFSQDKMREHLVSCFIAKSLTPFPTL